MTALRRYFARLLVAGLLVTGLAVSSDLGHASPAGDRLVQAGEWHPHIHRALREMREARQELKTANHDFGGHRVEALRALDAAVNQLEVALKYDRH